MNLGTLQRLVCGHDGLAHRARFVVLLTLAVTPELGAGCGVTTTATSPGPVAPDPVATEDVHANLIRLTTPRANAVVVSPLVVTGEARGTWYFEATFPVRLLDATGQVLVEHYAQAQGEWMTEAFVPFRAELRFAPPSTAIGTLVLAKNNPSDQRELDDALHMPIRFATGDAP